jgi:hypothetical protein
MHVITIKQLAHLNHTVCARCGVEERVADGAQVGVQVTIHVETWMVGALEGFLIAAEFI